MSFSIFYFNFFSNPTDYSFILLFYFSLLFFSSTNFFIYCCFSSTYNLLNSLIFLYFCSYSNWPYFTSTRSLTPDNLCSFSFTFSLSFTSSVSKPNIRSSYYFFIFFSRLFILSDFSLYLSCKAYKSRPNSYFSRTTLSIYFWKFPWSCRAPSDYFLSI